MKGTTGGALALLFALSTVCAADGMERTETWSPRQFCQAGGGTLSETPDPDVLVCCYDADRKCVLTDAQQRSSRVLATGDGGEGASTLRGNGQVSPVR